MVDVGAFFPFGRKAVVIALVRSGSKGRGIPAELAVRRRFFDRKAERRLPYYSKGFGRFFNKGTWPHIIPAAVKTALGCRGNIKLVAGSGYADVKKTAFFFQLSSGLFHTREHAFFQTSYDYAVIFQTLCIMQGDEGNCIVAHSLIFCIQSSVQIDCIQKL